MDENAMRGSQVEAAVEDRSCVQLTARQAEVVKLAAKGKTSKETARLLGLSKLTVDDYLDSARARVGAANKAELVAWAIASGFASYSALEGTVR